MTATKNSILRTGGVGSLALRKTDRFFMQFPAWLTLCLFLLLLLKGEKKIMSPPYRLFLALLIIFVLFLLLLLFVISPFSMFSGGKPLPLFFSFLLTFFSSLLSPTPPRNTPSQLVCDEGDGVFHCFLLLTPVATAMVSCGHRLHVEIPNILLCLWLTLLSWSPYFWWCYPLFKKCLQQHQEGEEVLRMMVH